MAWTKEERDLYFKKYQVARWGNRSMLYLATTFMVIVKCTELLSVN